MNDARMIEIQGEKMTRDEVISIIELEEHVAQRKYIKRAIESLRNILETSEYSIEKVRYIQGQCRALNNMLVLPTFLREELAEFDGQTKTPGM